MNFYKLLIKLPVFFLVAMNMMDANAFSCKLANASGKGVVLKAKWQINGSSLYDRSIWNLTVSEKKSAQLLYSKSAYSQDRFDGEYTFHATLDYDRTVDIHTRVGKPGIFSGVIEIPLLPDSFLGNGPIDSYYLPYDSEIIGLSAIFAIPSGTIGKTFKARFTILNQNENPGTPQAVPVNLALACEN